MRNFRLILRAIVVAGLVGIFSIGLAENLDSVELDLTHGARGCPPSYRITVELLGGPTGTAILGTGVIDPPNPNGFKANDFNRVRFNITPRVNTRLIKHVRLRVSGDGPGVPIREGWDVRRMKIINQSSRQVLWGHDEPVSFSWDSLTWTSPDWSTYDLEGNNTLARDWKLVVLTAGDDLRDDSSAGAVLFFRDGTSCRVDIGRGLGLKSRNASVLPIPLGSRNQRLSDLMKVVLFKSCYSKFGDFQSKFRYFGDRPSNADDWEISQIGVRVNLADRDNVEMDFRGLRGKITEGTKAVTINSLYEPIQFAPSLTNLNARLTVFLWGPYKGDDRPEIHALIRRRGDAEFQRVVYRRSVGQPYVGETADSIWQGFPSYLEDVRTSAIGEGSQNMSAIFKPWASGSQTPIEEVQIGLYQKGRGGGAVYEPYTGNAAVEVRGIWLGVAANNGTLTQGRTFQPDFANHMTLAMNLGLERITLSRTNRTKVYRITHTLPLRN